jgi:RNA polymerase sigma-70 factor, ECF subfamily
VVTRETIEIAFVAALQHLPPRQAAAVALGDALGWPAERGAEVVGASVAAFNSALQRGRDGLRRLLGDERDAWSVAAPADDDEAAVVRRFVAAIEASDDRALVDLLDEHVVVAHQPGAGGNETAEPVWYAGRATVLEAWAPVLHSPFPLAMRMVPVAVNRQPAVATYIRLPGTDHHSAFALNPLRIRGGRVVEVLTLDVGDLAALGIPDRLPDPTG